MAARSSPLALHTWSLDTTPLDDVLRVAQETGWDAVELRRLDFTRAHEAGRSTADVSQAVRAAGLPVAAVGVELGWMFAEGDERRRLLDVFTEGCRTAAALACRLVMSPVDPGSGSLRRAAGSVRQVGDLAAEHGVALTLEFQSQAEQFNTLERARELLALADHPACGLLLDTYHLERSGASGGSFRDVAPDEILYVQYSDVPRTTRPGYTLDRLPPGQGVVRFGEVFDLLAEKGYAGPLSYEAPNPAAWARNPAEVSREALEASRALLER